MNTTYQESKVSVYTSSDTVGTKNSNYTLLVDSDTGAPRVLTFLGYDRLFGSHYDKYIITYNSFTNDPPEPQTFEVPSGKANLYMQLMHILSVLYSHFYFSILVDSCGAFLSPGFSGPMVDGPFFEFFGAKGSSVSKTAHVDNHFNIFKKKHGKDYQTEREELFRKQHFHHNFRLARSTKPFCLVCGLVVNKHVWLFIIASIC